MPSLGNLETTEVERDATDDTPTQATETAVELAGTVADTSTETETAQEAVPEPAIIELDLARQSSEGIVSGEVIRVSESAFPLQNTVYVAAGEDTDLEES
jgi:hypothetical protein